MIPIEINNATPQYVVWKKASQLNGTDQVYQPTIQSNGKSIKVVPVRQNGSIQLVTVNGLSGLFGPLGLFKSASRKEAEKELPVLQSKITQQAQTITDLNNQIVQLQKLMQQSGSGIISIPGQSANTTTASFIPKMSTNTMLIAGGVIVASFIGYKVLSNKKAA